MQQMRDREGLDSDYVGGPFDRQVRIDDWNQKVLEKQTVLVLGVGGLGSVVVMNLLRLGVGKLIMVDYDVVDEHNLNRQLMFSRADLGKPKVECAKVNAQFHNCGKTQVETFHGNALTNWSKIVKMAKQSNFVYNCIDYGQFFDAAVASLCLALKLPLVMGGTFSTSMTVDYFPPAGRPCFICADDATASAPDAKKITPDLILELEDISFLQKNNNPVGRTNVVGCTICGEFMVAHFLNLLFLSEERPYKANRLLFYHNTLEMVNFGPMEHVKDCLFCHDEELEEKERLEREAKEQEQARKKEEEEAKKKEEDQAEKKEEETSKQNNSANTSKPEETKGQPNQVQKSQETIIDKVDSESHKKTEDNPQQQQSTPQVDPSPVQSTSTPPVSTQISVPPQHIQNKQQQNQIQIQRQPDQ